MKDIHSGGVYVPKYTPLSAGGAYYSEPIPAEVAPGQSLRFNRCGDLLNTLFESDGLTVTQPGLYVINFSAALSGTSVRVTLTANGSEVGTFADSRVNASFVKRLTPSTKISAVNSASNDLTEINAYLTVAQASEYYVSGFEYSPDLPA
ncbi:MAG: hypothetical protein LBN43_06535 [Oscillospiraceae bacterium]|jgi:hypothetical protein|nr:hypothetical protein [Oscillospiraceae bacterium]